MNAVIDKGVNEAIQRLLRERLNQYGFERADIRADRDHSGDPGLFIDVFYRLSREPLQTAFTLNLLTELRRLLMSKGEDRFPYLRHHFDERQQVAKVR